MKRWISVALIGSLLAGCQFIGTDRGDTAPPEIEDLGAPAPGVPERAERQVAFPEGEYAKLEKNGNAVLTGQLFVTTPSGQTVYGANETVSVAPATTYTAEAAEAALAGKVLEKQDPRAQEYTHYAKTDDRGYFKVTGLPSGVFYVGGRVSVPGGKRYVIIDQVRLSSGETAKITLDR
ncbi:carboxypeptidase-like regulatory domain-containing protein [Modicisalibacter xianhensis]|uniref:Carboxypeptidase regulatory-like domain-containing protein n=1 Tax=Modicisalibacter xianhensis TaxID=442341 RepID=A0A1I3A9T7_9GAMM|nr:carboxypeptidase-like regulatory domain-containing protein [Halomonas xianhensis]SFH46882.1 hypothetical protein SAMN04487959_104240 [Halomonas xianhensis]